MVPSADTYHSNLSPSWDSLEMLSNTAFYADATVYLVGTADEFNCMNLGSQKDRLRGLRTHWKDKEEHFQC